MRACVRVCVRSCMRDCICVCVRVRVSVCVCVSIHAGHAVAYWGRGCVEYRNGRLNRVPGVRAMLLPFRILGNFNPYTSEECSEGMIHFCCDILPSSSMRRRREVSCFDQHGYVITQNTVYVHTDLYMHV